MTWVSGDVHVSQHCALMGKEHNRLCSQTITQPEFSGMTVDQKFARAQNVCFRLPSFCILSL